MTTTRREYQQVSRRPVLLDISKKKDGLEYDLSYVRGLPGLRESYVSHPANKSSTISYRWSQENAKVLGELRLTKTKATVRSALTDKTLAEYASFSYSFSNKITQFFLLLQVHSARATGKGGK